MGEKLAIDLHMHTYYSDGLLSPEELLSLCARQGLRQVAVTDHDSVGGLDRAAAAAASLGMAFVPGVELTARFSGEMHILGYGIRRHDSGLCDFLQEQLALRMERNTRMVEQLRGVGLDVTDGEMRQEAGREEYGRLHMARVMVRRGYCRSLAEAFDRYLKPGCPGYVHREKPASALCIGVIRAAGGDAVLAHPGLMGLPDHQLEPIVSQLQGEGLAGVEVYYPQHTRSQILTLERIAAARGLVPTYGSDYHGRDRAGEEILRGWENYPIGKQTAEAAARWTYDAREEERA